MSKQDFADTLWRHVEGKPFQEQVELLFEIVRGSLDTYEKREPNWVALTFFDLLEGAVRSLRYFVEDPSDSSATWESPLLEIQFPVEWDWERRRVLSTTFGPGDLATPEGVRGTAVDLFLNHRAVHVLQLLTKGMATYRVGDKSYYLLPEAVDRAVADLPPDKVQGVLDPLFEPFILGAAEVDDEVVQRWEVDGTVPAEDLPNPDEIPTLRFSMSVNEQEVLTAGIVAAFHPLVVDEDEQRAYYPIVTGVFVEQVEIEPGTWTPEERAQFWDLLISKLASSTDEIRSAASDSPPELSELSDDVAGFVFRAAVVPPDDRSRVDKLRDLIIVKMADLDRCVRLLERALKEQASGDDGAANLALIAWHVHGWYTGTEGLLRSTARVLDGDTPGGGDSHAALLEQMAETASVLRPATLDDELHREMDELRKFRHFFRHAVAERLDAPKVLAQAQRTKSAHARLKEAFSRLDTHLHDAVQRGERRREILRYEPQSGLSLRE